MPVPGGPNSSSMAGQTSASTSTARWKRPRRGPYQGPITYHDTQHHRPTGVRLHGTVDTFFLEGRSPHAIEAGRYLPASRASTPPSSRASTGPRNDASPAERPGRFNVEVFDQGEPGSTKDFDGDPFIIRLFDDGSPSTCGWGPVQRLHPGRLHRGRQHPGGQH